MTSSPTQLLPAHGVPSLIGTVISTSQVLPCSWLLGSHLSTQALPPHRGLPKLFYVFCSQAHPAVRVLYHIFLTFPSFGILLIFETMFLFLLLSNNLSSQKRRAYWLAPQ